MKLKLELFSSSSGAEVRVISLEYTAFEDLAIAGDWALTDGEEPFYYGLYGQWHILSSSLRMIGRPHLSFSSEKYSPLRDFDSVVVRKSSGSQSNSNAKNGKHK